MTPGIRLTHSYFQPGTWKAIVARPCGNREPSLPCGPLNPWVCPQEGMLQHWELGQALRQRYHDFLNTSYHRQEVRLGVLEARAMGSAVLTLCPQGDYG